MYHRPARNLCIQQFSKYYSIYEPWALTSYCQIAPKQCSMNLLAFQEDETMKTAIHVVIFFLKTQNKKIHKAPSPRNT